MIVIGERIHIVSPVVKGAVKERDPRPLQELARRQAAGGADYLDVNLGPRGGGSPETMAWAVTAIQEAVDLPLSIDTTDPEAMEAGLAVHRGKAILNSVSGEPSRLEKMFPLAARYDCLVIGLTIAGSALPRDAEERAAVAVDILGRAAELGIGSDRLLLDPLVLPVSADQQQVPETLRAIGLFSQLSDPPAGTVIGLSNVSNGSPAESRPLLNRTFLMMALSAGLTAAILDPTDAELMLAAKTWKILANRSLYAPGFDRG
jgi:5-methyltetrahydrofolate corrinoid/iron sulfur protein methyltransferase